MFTKLRQRAQDEKGFTLIELLVVILIIGILAAIAIPSFLGQRDKANDSRAKSDARTAQTAAETIYTDNQNYDTVSTTTAQAIEPALADANILTASGSGNTFSVSVTAKGTGTVFMISRTATGAITRTCDNAGKGGCKGTGGGAGTW